MTQAFTLISGANRGIGLEVCRQLTRRNHFVLMGSRSVDAGRKAIQDANLQNCECVPLDVSDSKSIKNCVELISEKHKRLDCLINNAGFAIEDEAEKLDMADLRSVFETNLFGTVELTNSCLALLLKSPYARIVNVSSILGSTAEHADPNSAFIQNSKTTGYSMTKSAMNMYTVNLARALRKHHGVRVNSVHPGWIATDLGNMLGKAPSTVEFGAKQIVDTLGPNKRIELPTGGFYHNKLSLRW